MATAETVMKQQKEVSDFEVLVALGRAITQAEMKDLRVQATIDDGQFLINAMMGQMAHNNA